MDISSILNKDLIIPELKGKTKEDVFKELVDHLVSTKNIDHARRDILLSAVMERENCATTFLPIGVAIPHARTDVIDDIVMILGASKTGIEDSTDSGITANLFFLFFSPTNEKEFGRHLKILARIASIFSSKNFSKELSEINDADEMLSMIRQKEAELDKRK